MNDSLRGPGSPANPEINNGFDGTIRPVTTEDLAALQPILERWIFDPATGHTLTDEVNDSINAIKASIDGALERDYVVAENQEGQVVGIMGLVPVTAGMRQFTTSDKSAELINADVADEQRGKGVGRALVNHLESLAVQKGYDEIVVNSGPRYKDTGWPFWRKMYGEPVGTAKNYYGPGFDAMVWRSELTK